VVTVVAAATISLAPARGAMASVAQIDHDQTSSLNPARPLVKPATAAGSSIAPLQRSQDP